MIFHITPENGTLKYGFNFYPSNDPKPRGFKFMYKIGNKKYLLICRYVLFTKKWIFKKETIDLNNLESSIIRDYIRAGEL